MRMNNRTVGGICLLAFALGCSDDAAGPQSEMAASAESVSMSAASSGTGGGAVSAARSLAVSATSNLALSAAGFGSGGAGGLGSGGAGGGAMCLVDTGGGPSGTVYLETERQQVAAISAGDSVTILQSPDYSCGASTRLYANAVGDYLTLGPISYPTNPQGPNWDVQLTAATNQFAGKIQMQYAPSSSGPWHDLLAVVDLYSTTAGIHTMDLGHIIFQDAPTFIKFAIVGKNAASFAYFANVDLLTLVPVP
jgi:hypothetical protein